MSDDNNMPEVIEENVSEPVVEPQESSIPVKVYESTKTDMLKYKNETKSLKEQLAKMQADKDAEKSAQLIENKQFETLYKQANEKLTTIQKERETERSQFIDGHKVNAVVQSLGGFKKPEYNRFINKDAITLNEDGSVDTASVENEVVRIKKEYSELVKANSNSSLPNQAPTGIQPRELKDLSESERDELRRKLLTNQ